jgi:hypothetical protein
VDGYGHLDVDNNLDMTKEKGGKETVPFEMPFQVSLQRFQSGGFIHLEVNIPSQIVFNNVWFLGLVGVSIYFFLAKRRQFRRWF